MCIPSSPRRLRVAVEHRGRNAVATTTKSTIPTFPSYLATSFTSPLFLFSLDRACEICFRMICYRSRRILGTNQDARANNNIIVWNPRGEVSGIPIKTVSRLFRDKSDRRNHRGDIEAVQVIKRVKFGWIGWIAVETIRKKCVRVCV